MKKIIQKNQLTIGQTPTILYKFSYEILIALVPTLLNTIKKFT